MPHSCRCRHSSARVVALLWPFVVVIGSSVQPGFAGAQEPAQDTTLRSGVRLGDVVEFATPDSRRTDKWGSSIRCTGTVSAAGTDTIFVKQSSSCGARDFGRAEVESLSVRYNAGSRRKHTRVGVTLGAVLGGVVWKVLLPPLCIYQRSCDPLVKYGTATGVALGAVLGTVLGVLSDAGDQWRIIPVPAVIRVTSGTAEAASPPPYRDSSSDVRSSSIPIPLLHARR